jgi:hypothetical protein
VAPRAGKGFGPHVGAAAPPPPPPPPPPPAPPPPTPTPRRFGLSLGGKGGGGGGRGQRGGGPARPPCTCCWPCPAMPRRREGPRHRPRCPAHAPVVRGEEQRGHRGGQGLGAARREPATNESPLVSAVVCVLRLHRAGQVEELPRLLQLLLPSPPCPGRPGRPSLPARPGLRAGAAPPRRRPPPGRVGGRRPRRRGYGRGRGGGAALQGHRSGGGGGGGSPRGREALAGAMCAALALAARPRVDVLAAYRWAPYRASSTYSQAASPGQPWTAMAHPRWTAVA